MTRAPVRRFHAPAHEVLLVLAALAGSVTAHAATDPGICFDDTGDAAIEACNRVINSGRYTTEEVANGVRQSRP